MLTSCFYTLLLSKSHFISKEHGAYFFFGEKRVREAAERTSLLMHGPSLTRNAKPSLRHSPSSNRWESRSRKQPLPGKRAYLWSSFVLTPTWCNSSKRQPLSWAFQQSFPRLRMGRHGHSQGRQCRT